MTDEELYQSKWQLREEILKIQHQLDIAAAEEVTGSVPDPFWRAKAIMALGARQRYIEEIEDRLYLRKRSAITYLEPQYTV